MSQQRVYARETEAGHSRVYAGNKIIGRDEVVD
jgi:hypothetical protein